MSAQNDFALAVFMLSSLNTISQSSHGSDANLEYLQNDLFNRIRSMVSNNRRQAFAQTERQQILAIHGQWRSSQMGMEGTTNIPVSSTVSQPLVRRNPLEKTITIAKKKLEEDCPNDCAICQERPKFKNAVCTECEHYYCKTCWTGWMNAERSNKTCPTCRKEMPKITTFRARVSSKPVAAPARPMIIEEDDY